MLSVTLGDAEMAIEVLEEGTAVRSPLEQIRRAAERARHH
jgi:hypothetical protein